MMSTKERIEELRRLEEQDEKKRLAEAVEEINKVFDKYEVHFEYFGTAPSTGMPVPLKDLLPPGWGFVANIAPARGG